MRNSNVYLIVLFEAIRFFQKVPVTEFLFGLNWSPQTAIRADQVFSIGTVNGVPQPVVTTTALKNVPEKGIYNWDPGAYFGIYKPDSFWFTEARRQAGQ